MRYRGEITVFLSLTILCVMSLMLGLLESARTAGARLYLRMASDSAVSSVMSYYNRNLWDRYQLLFLEYDSEAAIQETFGRYLDFYLEQTNMYPARREKVSLSGVLRMTDEDGRWLEEEIADYMKYRVPELFASGSGLLKEAEQVKKAGDFRNLYDSCRKSGRAVRRLEKAAREVENSLLEMETCKNRFSNAASDESASALKRSARKLKKEFQDFPKLVEQFEQEIRRLEKENEESGFKTVEDETAAETLGQEISACGEVVKSAKEHLQRYREAETQVERNLELLEEACEYLEMKPDPDEEDDVDWDAISQCADEMEIPESENSGPKDAKKGAVSLNGIPSAGKHETGSENTGSGEMGILETAEKKLLVSKYIPLYFGSFTDGTGEADAALDYEMEYLLSGKKSDRENLKEAVNKVLMLRGSMNLLYLLNSPDKKAEAEALAAAVTAGIIPAQMAVSFLILTLWAFGEAVLDVKTLLAGGRVSFWKTDATWKTGLSGLLDQSFLGETAESGQDGRNYTEYLSCMMFLMDRGVRNFRMMDLIQWNIRMGQSDFSVASCAYQIEIEAEVMQKHMFFQKEEYRGTVHAAGSY